jgi:replicative DNA helicase
LLLAPAGVGNATLRAHARTVRDRARLRALLELVSRARGELYAGTIDDVPGFFETFEQSVFDLTRAELAGAKAEHVSAGSARDLEALRAARPLAYATGYPKLDWLLGGGLRPKGLSILGGHTSAGKSALAMNVAVHVAKGVGVFVASLEMTHEELAQRAAAALSGVELEHVREKRLSQSEHTRYFAGHADLGRRALFVADEPGQSITTIRAAARRVAAQLAREGGSLGLIVIDYLQLLKPLPGPKTETREQQVAALSRNLKGLAKDMNVHVLALAQLNAQHESRKGDEKRPRLGDLRESKAIANDADVVAFVHREDYAAERDDRDGKAPTRGHAEIIVAKHRGGRTGVFPVIFDRARCRFENPPPGHDADGVATGGT